MVYLYQTGYKMHDVIATIFLTIILVHFSIYYGIHVYVEKSYQLPMGAGMRKNCFSSVLPTFSKVSTYCL